MYPLNSLRAFEASARHQCFAKASEELYVTPAAVSQQVKKLEEYLGVVLFKRLTRSVLLTDAGKSLAGELSDVFIRLDKAVADIKQVDIQNGIDISVVPIFAINWLVPRLADFQQQFAELDLRMVSSLEVIDFKQDSFDAAIRMSDGKHPGCVSVKLMDEYLTPMCSPRLLEKHGPITCADDLLKYVLLHDESVQLNRVPITWQDWFEAADVINADTNTGPRFSQPDHAHQAAVNGLGVVLGWRKMAEADLNAGRLIAPLDLSIQIPASYYLVYPEAYKNEYKIQALQNWLLEQPD